MKRLLLVLLFLAAVSSAFAAELKVTGDMFVRGQTDSNLAVKESNKITSSYFDYEFNLNAAFVANENATVFVKLTYDKLVDEKGTVANGDAGATSPSTTTFQNSSLAVERCYFNYKFHPALQLESGLMAGGQWANTFGDTEINVMRVKVIGALSEDMVFVAIYQKDNENGINGGAVSTEKEEKEDANTYYLASQIKVAGLTILPLFVLVTTGYDYDTTTLDALYALGVATGYTFKTYAFDLGLNGDFGMFGFKSEGVYRMFDSGGLEDDIKKVPTAYVSATSALRQIKDAKTYGGYVDAFAKVEPITVGFVFAYAKADANGGLYGTYDWGEDFDVCYVMDDMIDNSSTKNNLVGYSVYKLYANVVVDKFSANVAGAYGKDNLSGAKDKFYEVDAGAGYAIDANASYSVAGGYAMLKKWDTTQKDANAWSVSHKFAIKF